MITFYGSYYGSPPVLTLSPMGCDLVQLNLLWTRADCLVLYSPRPRDADDVGERVLSEVGQREVEVDSFSFIDDDVAFRV